MDASGTGIYDANTKPSDVDVVVFGATGYIGRYVVAEFVRQGYAVTAFAREKSGVRGKGTQQSVQEDLHPAKVVFGNVCQPVDVDKAFVHFTPKRPMVVVSCLASRTGGIDDSNRIDYSATLNTLRAARTRGASHFILLSAICVQNPLLEFQRAKLRFEAELQKEAQLDPSFSYSVVRPTAFFKSLAAQIERMKKGASYLMFGDGALSKCNPLSERDLARFIVLCASDENKRNAILPVGGPDEPVTPKQQADIIFTLIGKQPKYLSLPIGLMDVSISVLDAFAAVLPFMRDAAEFAKIGKYYATEDMVGPSFGNDTLHAFFESAVKEGGLRDQDLGDANVF